MITIVLGWALITLLIVQPDAISDRQLTIWNWLMLTLCAVALIYGSITGVSAMRAGAIDWKKWAENFETTVGAVLALTVPFFIVASFYAAPMLKRSVNPSRRDEAPKSEDNAASGNDAARESALSPKDLTRWGKLATLIIMTLALFAFGVRYNAYQQKIIVNWDELPAILIVFLLAELGVSLVVVAQQVGDDVKQAQKNVAQASGDARLATAAVETAKDSLLEVKNQTKQAIADLSPQINKITLLADSELWVLGKAVPGSLSVDEPTFYDLLAKFTKSWIPKVTENEGALGRAALFRSFIGRTASHGTVRESDGKVCCIAADDIFAETAETWLTEMANGMKAGEELVVWAITRLLPPEFAFPTAYRGGSEHDAERGKALENFISSVIRVCHEDRARVGEYIRVTVLDNDEYMTLNRGPMSGDSLTLSNWFILDRRMPSTDVSRLYDSDWTGIHRVSQRIATQQGGLLTRDAITPATLGHAFDERPAPGDRFNLFPFTSDGPETLFDFRINVGVELRVFGSGAGRWNARISKEALIDSGLSPQFSTEMDNWQIRDVLKRIGWKTLLDWYIDGMHKLGGRKLGAAWWTVVDHKDASFFDPLSLDWGGTRVRTHDLLLLGSRRKGKSTIRWHGAAISNLTANRTECTIQLVTGIDDLASIATVVTKLCGDFTAAPAHMDPNVIAYGTWRDWPGPTWMRQRESPATSAEENSSAP
jgi:hypothetical protein